MFKKDKDKKEKRLQRLQRRKFARERLQKFKEIRKNEKIKEKYNKYNFFSDNIRAPEKKLSTIGKLKFNLGQNIFKRYTKTTIEGIQITFLGATQTVTGSKYLLESNKSKILIDCGLFQGIKELRLRNWNEFPINPKHIDAIILTHAHLDHTGYLPLLTKNGFKGKIYCTESTKDLSKLIIPDSGFLQEEEARYAKKKGYSKHFNPKPLYTQKDALDSLKNFCIVDFHKNIEVDDEFSFSFTKAGHILGASSVLVKTKEKSILFSGDLGRKDSPIVTHPESCPVADYVLIESTYGNRFHTQEDAKEFLESIINKTSSKGGKIIIPAFAVGRTQKILYYINELKKTHKIPNIPIFLDSPMSIKVTALVNDYVKEGKLTKERYKELYDDVKFCVTRVQSKKILEFKGPCIIISASGMAAGGRVLHHIANFAPNPDTTIILVGYQAEGTRGRDLQDGKKEIKIHGQIIPIRANIVNMGGMSDHGDQNELLEWLKTMPSNPKRVFVVHGEEEQSRIFADKIKELGIDAIVPEYLENKKL
jgi:metallo-beta-lactamase family protein